MHRFVVYVAAFVLVGSTIAPAAGAATPRVKLSVSRQSEVVWFEAKVGSGEIHAVKIKVFTPRRSGDRSLWQTCRLAFSGAGTYRCGMDAAQDSNAVRRKGAWKARVYLDSARTATVGFRLRTKPHQK